MALQPLPTNTARGFINLAIRETGTPGVFATVMADMPDQDPIYDHINGVAANVTAAPTLVITPPNDCKFILITATVDVWLRCDDGTPTSDGKSRLCIANQEYVVPVTEAVDVNAVCVSAANGIVYALPFKAR